MSDAVIIDAVRTPLGQGALHVVMRRPLDLRKGLE